MSRRAAIVHRFTFPIREAVEALLGEAAGDAEAWQVRVEGDQVVVDVVGPAIAAPSVEPTQDDVASTPADPELKGGPLAQRAAICCGERGFWTLVGAANADEARAFVLRRCGVTSRKMLDHDARAAAAWREIDVAYGLWKEGYNDVEI